METAITVGLIIAVAAFAFVWGHTHGRHYERAQITYRLRHPSPMGDDSLAGDDRTLYQTGYRTGFRHAASKAQGRG